MIIVSACLTGVKCRYDGNDNEEADIKALFTEGKAIPICPEVLGELSIPRGPAEIVGGKVINFERRDITENFLTGAEKTLEIAKSVKCSLAILKSRSPSCGKGEIYDGSFSKILKTGNGITAELLLKNDIEVIT